MNAIEFAKNHILNEIDDEVLTFCFRSTYGNTVIGAMSVLENKIIRNIVIKELNMLDGEEKKIPYHACKIVFQGIDSTLIEIPARVLNNRPLLAADYIMSGSMGQNRLGGAGGLLGTAMSMLNTSLPSDTYSNCRLEVINNNLIKASDINFIEPNAVISVRVQANPNLSNLPSTTHVDFAELCLVATQKWIYAKKRKDINVAILRGGVELSVIKEIVDEWSDAKDKYKEERSRFISIMNMADKRFMNEQIALNVGNLKY